MPTIHSKYLGDLRTEQQHVASGQKFITDAPIDNHGKGEAISPTDSVCAALSACMMTLMGIAARTHEISIDGLQADVTKHMGADPRRIRAIDIRFYGFEQVLDAKQQLILERAAKTCPVAMSLHPDLKQNITFEFGS